MWKKLLLFPHNVYTFEKFKLFLLFLVFQFLVPKSLKYLKMNSKTVAYVNIYGYIYIC